MSPRFHLPRDANIGSLFLLSYSLFLLDRVVFLDLAERVPLGQHFSHGNSPENTCALPTSLAMDKKTSMLTHELGMSWKVGQAENWVNAIASDPQSRIG